MEQDSCGAFCRSYREPNAFRRLQRLDNPEQALGRGVAARPKHALEALAGFAGCFRQAIEGAILGTPYLIKPDALRTGAVNGKTAVTPFRIFLFHPGKYGDITPAYDVGNTFSHGTA